MYCMSNDQYCTFMCMCNTATEVVLRILDTTDTCVLHIPQYCTYSQKSSIASEYKDTDVSTRHPGRGSGGGGGSGSGAQARCLRCGKTGMLRQLTACGHAIACYNGVRLVSRLGVSSLVGGRLAFTTPGDAERSP